MRLALRFLGDGDTFAGETVTRGAIVGEVTVPSDDPEFVASLREHLRRGRVAFEPVKGSGAASPPAPPAPPPAGEGDGEGDPPAGELALGPPKRGRGRPRRS